MNKLLFMAFVLMPSLCLSQLKGKTLSQYNRDKNIELLDLASNAYNAGNYSNALNLLNDFIARDTGYYYAYYMRGKCKWNLNNNGTDPTEIINDFNHAIRLNYTFADAYCEKASIEKANDHDAGLYDFNMAIKYCKENDRLAYYYGLRADLKCDMLNWVGALADANKSILLEPKDNFNAYQARAQVYMENGAYQKAIADCDRVIDMPYPQSYFIFYVRGVSKYKIGNQEGACEDLERAQTLSDTYFTREALKKYCK